MGQTYDSSGMNSYAVDLSTVAEFEAFYTYLNVWFTKLRLNSPLPLLKMSYFFNFFYSNLTNSAKLNKNTMIS